MIILYPCAVCINTDCTEKEPQEVCDIFMYSKKVRWMMDCACPNCENSGMLYQDKFGAACMITDCNFTQDYKKE